MEFIAPVIGALATLATAIALIIKASRATGREVRHENRQLHAFRELAERLVRLLLRRLETAGLDQDEPIREAHQAFKQLGAEIDGGPADEPDPT